jgi:hypothetical protein
MPQVVLSRDTPGGLDPGLRGATMYEFVAICFVRAFSSVR